MKGLNDTSDPVDDEKRRGKSSKPRHIRSQARSRSAIAAEARVAAEQKAERERQEVHPLTHSHPSNPRPSRGHDFLLTSLTC